jgi:hypothetical protein
VFGCSTAPLFSMDEDDVNTLLEEAKCLTDCLTEGQLNYAETYLLSAWYFYLVSG